MIWNSNVEFKSRDNLGDLIRLNFQKIIYTNYSIINLKIWNSNVECKSRNNLTDLIWLNH